MLPSAIAAAFHSHFGHEPLVVRAPGRVNLIGEHTDYNGGFVLPAAVDKGITFAVGLNGTDTINLVAHDLNQTHTFSLMQEIKPTKTQWANYLLGVVAQLQRKGLKVPGFDCMFGGDVPIGAGMSSSAAIECGLAFALNKLLGGKFDRLELAHMGQAAEHEFAGVKSGLMDQFASLYGRAGHVVRLDCRSLDYEYFPFDTTTYRLILCNSGVKHSLASSEYNTRRQECEQGVALIKQYYPAVRSLRDITLTQLQEHQAELGDLLYRRCSYVVEENQRVEAACLHLLAGDMPAVGQEMYGSHAGLRDKYEVSCRELDVLVELAQGAPGVLGARMMGGGFGGCTINLVETAHADDFVARMTAGYQQQLNLPLETYQVVIVDGVNVVSGPAGS